MGQITVRAPDDLIARVKRTADLMGRSMNEWIVVVLDSATNPDLAGDEASRLRERLRAAGLLVDDRTSASGSIRPSDDDLERAGRALAAGKLVSEIVVEDR